RQAAFVSAGVNHVIYRSAADRHLHELFWWWAGPNPPASRDLTPNGPVSAGDPAALVASDGNNNAIYRSADGHLQKLSWKGSDPVVLQDLTALTNSPTAASNTAAYSVAADGKQHVIYRSANGHLHEL